MTPHSIVAEITVNWHSAKGQNAPPIGSQFERVIQHNRERGYRLASWKLDRVVHPDYGDSSCWVINECIVAVFERDDAADDGGPK